MKKTDLEDRLIDFSVRLIELVHEIPKTKAGNHLSGQLIRCGTSPALNYGEARRAESRKDFIHKIQIVLKELSETLVILKILHRSKLYRSKEEVSKQLMECDELIAIFVKSVQTARKSDA